MRLYSSAEFNVLLVLRIQDEHLLQSITQLWRKKKEIYATLWHRMSISFGEK